MNLTKTENGEVTQSGGVIRVQHGAPAPEASTPLQAPHESTRVGNQFHRYERGELKSGGVVRYQAGADVPSRPGVMATAKREGGVLSVELEPGNPASRTGIESALREGLIRQTGPGIYEDMAPTPEAPAREQQPAEASEEQPFGFLDPGEVATWNEAVESELSSHSYTAAAMGTIAAIAAGKDLDGVGRALAASNGLEPSRGLEFVDTGVEFTKRSLSRDLVKQGLCTSDNVEQFYASIVGHAQLTRALQEVALEGKTTTFRTLAAAWRRDENLRTQGSMKDDLTRSGLDSMVDPKTGNLLVRKGSGPWVAISKL